ncbi:MAG: fluoride efflux transporter FluC [Ktedonobacterales bacterium]
MASVALVVAIGLAGALGAAARFGVAEWSARHWRGPFPLGTLLINVSGAFVLGLVLSAAPVRAPLPSGMRAVLGTGFLGGYTTFSTLCFETHASARLGRIHSAWLNAVSSLALGILAAALGIALGHAL